MNMLLYAICLNPLLSTLDKYLIGLGIGRVRARTSVIGYADDVTALVTAPSDNQKIRRPTLPRGSDRGKSEQWEIAGSSNRILGHLVQDHGHSIPQ